jgi:hypothetical protein
MIEPDAEALHRALRAPEVGGLEQSSDAITCGREDCRKFPREMWWIEGGDMGETYKAIEVTKPGPFIILG